MSPSQNSHGSNATGDQGLRTASSDGSSAVPRSWISKSGFQIRASTPPSHPPSPPRPVSAGSLDPDSLRGLVDGMYEQMATIRTDDGVHPSEFGSDILVYIAPKCETTGEALDFGKLSAKGDDGSKEIEVTLCQLLPGKLSGYFEIKSRDVASGEELAFGEKRIRVSNRWLIEPDIQSFKDVYLPNVFGKGKWLGFLGAKSFRAEAKVMASTWALCRVVYERYVALHGIGMPFDFSELPEETE